MIQNFTKWELNEGRIPYINLLTTRQIEWCNKYLDVKWKVNSKGEICCKSIVFKKGADFTKFEVQFADIEGTFILSYSKITSLEGSPRKVGDIFLIRESPNLTSLKGAPEEVGNYFDIRSCLNLSTLEGSPKKVGVRFQIAECPKISSLEGITNDIGTEIVIQNTGIISLKGSPDTVEGIRISDCPNLKTLEGIPHILGKLGIMLTNCPKLNPKEANLLKNEELFRLWIKANTPPIEEFLDPKGKWRGAITGNKFRI